MFPVSRWIRYSAVWTSTVIAPSDHARTRITKANNIARIPVTHASIASFSGRMRWTSVMISATAQVIDNGDAGFATVGGWSPYANEGYQNDIHYSVPGDGTNVATWTFSVTPGVYRVAATWSTHANRATDAPFTVLDGAAPVASVQINQQLAQGLDLNGDFGATLFRNINDPALLGQRSIAQGGNSAGSGNFEVTITDTSQLGVHDYEVKFTSATEFTVRRSDGTDSGPHRVCGSDRQRLQRPREKQQARRYRQESSERGPQTGEPVRVLQADRPNDLE